MSEDKYSYCEAITAGANTPWHIRKLTDKGKKMGGGADTPALCGRQVSWDIKTPVTLNDEFACEACMCAYQLRTEDKE